ncbi:MAG TPA: cupin domain-containing protein, partial [Tahibacter sp.]|nr:cupin domain-containing protein [Tahibacter sp.]
MTEIDTTAEPGRRERKRAQTLDHLAAVAFALFDLPREAVSERSDILRHGGGGAPTHMVCGAVRFDHPAARQLVALLPKA